MKAFNTLLLFYSYINFVMFRPCACSFSGYSAYFFSLPCPADEKNIDFQLDFLNLISNNQTYCKFIKLTSICDLTSMLI